MQEQLARTLGRLIEAAQRIFVLTGAGISTNSNIPDFRGPNGIYKQRAPVYYQEFLASAESRSEYWDFKLQGYAAFRDAQPNPAHLALVALEKLGKLQLLVTQNVDGLHQLAGTCQDLLLELHGSNRQVECIRCGTREDPKRCMLEFQRTGQPPVCLECGDWMKPAVVMFGQSLCPESLQRALKASAEADLILALGSSLVVTPAADLPLAGVRRGAKYVIINQGATPHDSLATLRIDGDVGQYLCAALAFATSA